MKPRPEDEMIGLVFLFVVVVVGAIGIGIYCWLEERKFKSLSKCCTAEKVLSTLKASNIHFGFYRAGVFVTDQSDVYLEVVVSRAQAEPSKEERVRTSRKWPKDIYHAKRQSCATTFVVEFLIKTRSGGRVLHAEFYKFRALSFSTSDDQSLSVFLEEWIAFFNDHHCQNDGEKQYFCHRSSKTDDVVHIDRGVTVYDAASTRLPSKVSISGNGQMIVHGNVTM